MLRNRSTLILSLLAGLAVLIGGSVTSASAAPSSYPPTPGDSLSVSTTTPFAGESITISGGGWKPRILVTITIHSQVVTLGTTTTSASGSFAATVTIPSDLRGHHTIMASAANGPEVTLSVFVDASSSTSAPGSGKTSGGLPFTGIDVYALGGLSVLLMLAGATMLFTGRRRRPSTA